MSEAKRRKYREGVEDFTATPDRLKKLIDSGKSTALVNFHLVDQADGTTKLAMISAGITPQDIFDACCVIRRTYMMMLGFAEEQPIAEAMDDGLPPADDELPAACQLCARDYWTVLAKCEHQNCPKGLYSK